MPHPALHVSDLPAGVALVPGAIELLGRSPQLHDEVAGQVLRLSLAALLAPQPHQSCFVAAHNDAGVGAADDPKTLAIIEKVLIRAGIEFTNGDQPGVRL